MVPYAGCQATRLVRQRTVMVSMGLDPSVNQLTYRELQARRELIQKRMRDQATA